MGELTVHSATVDVVRTTLAAGRHAVEALAGTEPGCVDAGELTALVLGMLSRLLDNASGVSVALAALAAQVDLVEAHLRSTDVDQEMAYLRASTRVGVGAR